jgi:hypothetical protein
MIPENLQKAEREFRRRIARRDYQDLASHLDHLRTMITEQLASLPAHDPARLELIAWGIVLTDWGRKMICTQRQKWANEKQPIDKIGRYLGRPAAPTGQVCIDL